MLFHILNYGPTNELLATLAAPPYPRCDEHVEFHIKYVGHQRITLNVLNFWCSERFAGAELRYIALGLRGSYVWLGGGELK